MVSTAWCTMRRVLTTTSQAVGECMDGVCCRCRLPCSSCTVWLHTASTCLLHQALCWCLQMADQGPLAKVEEEILEVELEIKDVKQEINDVKKGRREDE